MQPQQPPITIIQRQQKFNSPPRRLSKASSNASTVSATSPSSSGSSPSPTRSSPSSNTSSNSSSLQSSFYLPPPPRIKRSSAAGNNTNNTPPRPTSRQSSPPSQSSTTVGPRTPRRSPPPPPRVRRISKDFVLSKWTTAEAEATEDNASSAPLLAAKVKLQRSSGPPPPNPFYSNNENENNMASNEIRQLEQQALLSDIHANNNSSSSSNSKDIRINLRKQEDIDDSDDIYAQLNQFGQNLDVELSDLAVLGVGGSGGSESIMQSSEVLVSGDHSAEITSDDDESTVMRKKKRKKDKKKQKKQTKKDSKQHEQHADSSKRIYQTNVTTPERNAFAQTTSSFAYGDPSATGNTWNYLNIHTGEDEEDTFLLNGEERLPQRWSPKRMSKVLPIGSINQQQKRSSPSRSAAPATLPPPPPRLANNNRAASSSLQSSASLYFNDNNNRNDTIHHSSNIEGTNNQNSNDFPSSTVHAALVERLRAKERYQRETLRMQSLLNQGNGSASSSSSSDDGQCQQPVYQNNHHQPRHQIHQVERQHLQPRNQSRLMNNQRLVSLKNNDSNDTSQEQQSESSIEVQIHPNSIEGTTAAAAWHLHGQVSVGGRMYQPDENYSIMNSSNMSSGINVVKDYGRSNEEEGDGLTTLSAKTMGRAASPRSSDFKTSPTHHQYHHGGSGDQWSTGIAAAIVTGTASRYYKSFFLFPHGRRVLLPIFMGVLGCVLSFLVVFSCQFMTIVPLRHYESSSSNNFDGVITVDDVNIHTINQGAFQVGPWRYLSINPTYSDGEVCLPYPSDMVLDTPFLMARITSALSSCLGCALVLWTCTLLCVPANTGSMVGLGVCFVLNGMLQCLTAILYQSQNCKSGSIADEDNGGRGGYFGNHGECHPNQDLVFCIASGILFLATGWILYVISNSSFTNNNNTVEGSRSTNTKQPGFQPMEVYTWSSEAKSSNPKRGILRTVEKSWVVIPNGSTLMATVFVEQKRQQKNSIGGGNNNGDQNGKIKTTYSIQTEILPA